MMNKALVALAVIVGVVALVTIVPFFLARYFGIWLLPPKFHWRR